MNIAFTGTACWVTSYIIWNVWLKVHTKKCIKSVYSHKELRKSLYISVSNNVFYSLHIIISVIHILNPGNNLWMDTLYIGRFKDIHFDCERNYNWQYWTAFNDILYSLASVSSLNQFFHFPHRPSSHLDEQSKVITRLVVLLRVNSTQPRSFWHPYLWLSL